MHLLRGGRCAVRWVCHGSVGRGQIVTVNVDLMLVWGKEEGKIYQDTKRAILQFDDVVDFV